MVILPEKFKYMKEEDCKEPVLEMSVQGVNDSNKVLEGSSGAIIKEEYPNKPTRVILEKPTPSHDQAYQTFVHQSSRKREASVKGVD